VAAESRILEAGLAQLYALALVAIVRADEQIEPEEGQRLQQQIDARTDRPTPLEDLLLAEPLDPEVLAEHVRAEAGPFRGGSIHPGELARMIVLDAISVVLAKGHVSEQEAQQILRFATALGCTIDEVRAMTEHLDPWLPGLR
jgi:tellurite resistance protein